jgi:alkylhydroperoxidase family enzyme
MLAHGALLRKNFFDAQQLQAIIKDYRHAGLTDEEVTLMSFAQAVINDPKEVSQEQVGELRQLGLTDEEILDITVAVTARSFFSKTLDALDIHPDETYRDLEPDLIQALTIGRLFA